MAPPILTIRNLDLTFGGKPLFADFSFYLNKGDKVCLIGRNGSGKSTLLKVLAGLVEGDTGDVFVQPGTKVVYLAQDVALPADQTILEFLLQTTSCESYEAESVLEVLGMNGTQSMAHLSGGERRRVALAQALVQSPDVLLLDEPTNHLDLPAIEWLEQSLNRFNGALVTISHDRRFLEKVSTSTAWLDRGRLLMNSKGFADFERWSDEVMAEEERQLEKMDSKMRLEMDWLLRGVTARRKRNQGRLRRLHQLRDQRRALIANKTGKMSLGTAEGAVGSKMVIEAQGISKKYGDRVLVNNFSTRIVRGDRIGIIGPNGAGKSTLVKMLVGVLEPDQGDVRLGVGNQLIYFDQMRATLNPNETVWESLCEGGGDQVLVQGKPKHVVAYLKDFLFQEKQAHSPVSILSGGEKNRLALAKALTQPGNLLVLDEPTNDLDMDTLDLLQELLSDFEGTLLIVSHDRDFLDKLTTSLIAVEGDGIIREYVGGYDDYLRQRPQPVAAPVIGVKEPVRPSPKTPSQRLSFNDKRDYEQLPGQIETLTREINEAENRLSDPEFYQKSPKEFDKVTKWLEGARADLDTKEMRWLELDERVSSGA